MLPTFVIGLREGLEAALIVGIIAAFLRKLGRRDLLRSVFLGVGIALVLCAAVGIGLELYSRDLPQRQQEGLETVIGVLAVAMVTYMVVWMRRHSRELKGQLENMASTAVDGGGSAARAMVVMAFLAVLREGFETAVFLLAAFNESANGASAAVGAALGVMVAVVLGYGIYRGGVRINLSKFFRATGLVLVLVAAGLVVNALHTAHEAGWLNSGQGPTIDLTWLVSPGSVQASLLTGMLGIQSHPVVIEVIGWLAYMIPVGIYVAWPPGRAVPTRTTARALLGSGIALALTAAILAIAIPDAPTARPATGAGKQFAQVQAIGNGTVRVRASVVPDEPAATSTVTLTGSERHKGVAADVYTERRTGTDSDGLPTRLSYARIAQLNGGRLPIGVVRVDTGAAPVAYASDTSLTVWIQPRTSRVIDVRWRKRITASIVQPGRVPLPLNTPVVVRTAGLSDKVVAVATRAARADVATLDDRSLRTGLSWTSGILALVATLVGLALAALTRSRRSPEVGRTPDRVDKLVRS